jgi:phosphoadenosine phosphosulfate reductase
MSHDTVTLPVLPTELETAHPREILAWVRDHVPGTVVSTSFQPSGLVILDLLKELAWKPPVVFLDTLHHFPETLALAEEAREFFGIDLRIYRPQGFGTAAELAKAHGEELWERDLDLYQEITKVEPMKRALDELGARAWISGRRRDQSEGRATIPVVEPKGERLKVNPLANWTKKETWAWILEKGLPYNPLHDQGYPSIGDAPLTAPVEAGEDERSGRWKGKGKSECGIHTRI